MIRQPPSIDLYGEPGAWPRHELAHCEPLFERSARHNWRISAHSHGSILQLFLISSGQGEASIDGNSLLLEDEHLLLVPAGAVHGFEWRQDSQGFVLSIAAELLPSLVAVHQRQSFDRPWLRATGNSHCLIMAVMKELAEGQRASIMSNEYRESLLKVIVNWIVNQQDVAHRSMPSTRAARHFQRFLELLRRQPAGMMAVQEFAGALGITASHLNAVCHSEKGKSALAVIHEQRILEAQRLLTYTDHSIAVIADVLGFNDASYFSRFFRKHTGCSPVVYRQHSGTRNIYSSLK